MGELFAKSGDPDQTPRSAVSDLGLHRLPVTRLEISNLQWIDSCSMYFCKYTNLQNKYFKEKIAESN